MKTVKLSGSNFYKTSNGSNVKVEEAQLQLPGMHIGFTECPVVIDGPPASSGIQLKLPADHADAPNGHLLIYFVYFDGTMTAIVEVYDSSCNLVSTHTFDEDIIIQ